MTTQPRPNAPPSATAMSWILHLATRMLASSLNLPEPLVHSSGVLLFAQVQAAETRAAKSLCPFRLLRQLRAWLRKAFTHPATKGELP